MHNSSSGVARGDVEGEAIPPALVTSLWPEAPQPVATVLVSSASPSQTPHAVSPGRETPPVVMP
ncbi:hypothetical protein SY2F82_00400 [Streptomyces sp. Y2F8-2]|nr:hypothetical protein SY2F82_00400 [Streptomyces sp. Y2F8-2]